MQASTFPFLPKVVQFVLCYLLPEIPQICIIEVIFMTAIVQEKGNSFKI